MAGRVLKVVPARVGVWQDCPRRYYLQYVAKRPQRGGPWGHLELGNAVHRAAARWTEHPPGERTQARLAHYLAEEWTGKGFRDGKQSDDTLMRATGWVRDYASRPEHSGAVVVGAERSVACRYKDDVVLEGRVDRVDDRDGQLITVDYKTGRRPLTEADAAGSGALALYCLAAGRLLKRRCARAELHHLPTGDVLAVDYDAARIYRQIDRLVDAAREADKATQTYTDVVRDGASAEQGQNALFPTRLGPLCASCPFRYACPDGQAAWPEAEAWAYVDDLAVPA